jgi:hypothetical protein
MRSLLTLLLFTWVQGAVAFIHCEGTVDRGTISVKVIDTFVERMALLSRTDLNHKYPLKGMAISSTEEGEEGVIFKADGMNFILKVSHLQQSLVPGTLNYMDLETRVECRLE